VLLFIVLVLWLFFCWCCRSSCKLRYLLVQPSLLFFLCWCYYFSHVCVASPILTHVRRNSKLGALYFWQALRGEGFPIFFMFFHFFVWFFFSFFLCFVSLDNFFFYKFFCKIFLICIFPYISLQNSITCCFVKVYEIYLILFCKCLKSKLHLVNVGFDGS
jgi:hypothetical protein